MFSFLKATITLKNAIFRIKNYIARKLMLSKFVIKAYHDKRYLNDTIFFFQV